MNPLHPIYRFETTAPKKLVYRSGAVLHPVEIKKIEVTAYGFEVQEYFGDLIDSNTFLHLCFRL